MANIIMRIVDILRKHHWVLTPIIADLLAPAVKEIFPNVYEAAQAKKWSNYNIVNYVLWLDLDETDVSKILQLFARLSKISAFT